MNIDDIFERLFNYFKTSTIRELSEKINMSESTVSKWRQRESINAVKKRCRELGIYNEIFGDLNSNINNQIIRDNHSNISQTGDVYCSKDNNELNNIDETALSTFKRAYSKCIDGHGNIIEDKLDELIIYLTKFK